MPDNHPLCMGYADPGIEHRSPHGFQGSRPFRRHRKAVDYRLALGGARASSLPPQNLFKWTSTRRNSDRIRRLDAGHLQRCKTGIAGHVCCPSRRTAWLDHLRDLRLQCERRITNQQMARGSPLHPAAFYAELERFPRKPFLPGTVAILRTGGAPPYPAMHNGGWLALGAARDNRLRAPQRTRSPASAS